MSSKEKFQRFGRYLILDHLVDGGMAKICRARFLGEQADKVVAIKMVQPQFSRDESFKTMFMDEIKVTFGLIHPNIIQTYDYGYNDEQLYVAMEYVDGKNLKQYLDKLKTMGYVFPVEVTVYIISQTCQGLFYSHTFTDKLTGEPANIIHRDISPHNIMLTYDGNIKVIDYGIAKSKTNSESTQAGTIKGKLSYLAPEYLEGKELNPAYDQFAVGITMWEMLCSRKLFRASNDLAVLKKIQECKIPAPSSINPNVPKELDQIVMKALSKNRDDRYDSLDMLNRALMKFLYANYPDFNATDLSYFAKELFKDDIKEDRAKLFEFGKIDLAPYLADLKHDGTDQSAHAEGSASAKKHTKGEQEIDFGFEPTKSSTGLLNRKKTPQKAGVSSLGLEVKTKNTRRSSHTTTIVNRSGGKTRTSGRVNSSTRVKKSQREDREIEKKSSLSQLIKIIIFCSVVFYGYTKFKKEIHEIIFGVSSTTNTKISEKVKEKKVIIIKGFDQQKHKVFVNGLRIGPNILGIYYYDFKVGDVVRVEEDNLEHLVVYISEENVKSNEFLIDLLSQKRKSVSYGFVTMNASCVQGELVFELFGEKRQLSLPLNGAFIAIPVQQEISAFYLDKSRSKVEKKITIKVNREGEYVDLCNLLE